MTHYSRNENCLHPQRAWIAQRGRMLMVKLATVNDLIDTHFKVNASYIINAPPLR